MSTSPFDPELETGLREAVDSLHQKMLEHYADAAPSELMADFHYLAGELVDRQMDELVADHPELGAPDGEQGAVLDLREQVARRVHRLIEERRVAD